MIESWISIETAPKDGTEIIVKIPTKRGFTITRVMWNGNEWFKVTAPKRIIEAPSHWLPVGYHPLKETK